MLSRPDARYCGETGSRRKDCGDGRAPDARVAVVAGPPGEPKRKGERLSGGSCHHRNDFT
ncbi:MAG: hypothetical protein MJY44_05950 [Bacteroidales bacterium]|nr:hypothetical protein [Bacteroidales bacterium]